MITEFPAFYGSQGFMIELHSGLPFDIVPINCNSSYALKVWYSGWIIFLPSRFLESLLATVGATCLFSVWHDCSRITVSFTANFGVAHCVFYHKSWYLHTVVQATSIPSSLTLSFYVFPSESQTKLTSIEAAWCTVGNVLLLLYENVCHSILTF
jgi:hypothetical protein